MSTPPRIGQRVRFTRHNHPEVPPGRGGMIDQLGSDSEFFVLTWFSTPSTSPCEPRRCAMTAPSRPFRPNPIPHDTRRQGQARG